MTEIAVTPAVVPERPPMLDIVSRFLSVKAYFRTRRALAAGEKLYEYDEVAISQRKYVGPWSFNLQESTLAALPAVALAKVLNYLFDADPAQHMFRDVLGITSKRGVYADAIYPDIVGTFTPALPALILLATAWIIARCSLYRADATRARVERAKYAFLYLDGAHGLAPQAIAAFAIVATTWTGTHTRVLLAHFDPAVIISAVLISQFAGLIAGMRMLFITGRRVPRRLFELNGYSPEPYFISKKGIDRPAPWTKYTSGLVFGASVTAWAMVAVTVALSVGLAWLCGCAKAALR